MGQLRCDQNKKKIDLSQSFGNCVSIKKQKKHMALKEDCGQIWLQISDASDRLWGIWYLRSRNTPLSSAWK